MCVCVCVCVFVRVRVRIIAVDKHDLLQRFNQALKNETLLVTLNAIYNLSVEEKKSYSFYQLSFQGN